jgi:hypothetical protein
LQDNVQFIIIQRGACITFFATATFAFGKVANELFLHYIIAYQYVVDNYQIKGLQQK